MVGSFVLCRGGTFSFRCRVPRRLAPKIGRHEIVKALGVDQLPVARFFGAAIGLRLKELWAALDVDDLGADANRLIDEWFDREVKRVWAQFARGDLARAIVPTDATPDEEHEVQRQTMRATAEDRLERLNSAYQVDDYSAGYPVARKIAADLPDPLAEDDRRFTLLAKAIVEAMGQIEEGRFQWATGNIGCSPVRTPPSAPPTGTVSGPALESSGAEEEAPTLREIGEQFLGHRRQERKPTAKMLSQLRSQLAILTDALGADTKVTDITPRDAGRVFNALRAVPKNFRSHPDLTGLSLFEAAKKASDANLSAMHGKTVNNYMTTYRGLFKEAIDSSLIQENPFRRKFVIVPDSLESDRGFTQDELHSLLSSPVFVGCERANRPFQPGTHLLTDWRFWGPLIALFTGSRVAEIAQLSTKDIINVGGVWVLNITRQENRRTKTIQSVRKIPIHDELIRLGLIGFSKSKPANSAPGSLLGIPEPRNGDWGKKMGNWLRERLLPSVFEDTKRNGSGFHSFRHNIETELRAAQVRKDVGDRLMGHKVADVAGRYGKYEAETAKQALMKLEFPGQVKRIPARYPEHSPKDSASGQTLERPSIDQEDDMGNTTIV